MERRIKVAIDYDGVLVERAKSTDILKKYTKIGSIPVKEAKDGIIYLNQQPDVDVLGIYTSRIPWAMGVQTRRQIQRMALPVDKLTYTPLSTKRKIENVLSDATDEDNNSQQETKVVLIDDNIKRLASGTNKLLQENPGAAETLQSVTFVAFNQDSLQENAGLSIPAIMNVVYMKNWGDIQNTIDQIRCSE